MNYYVMVYADNLQELANSTVYVNKDVAVAILPNYQLLEKNSGSDREIWVQPIPVDTRTIDKLEK